MTVVTMIQILMILPSLAYKILPKFSPSKWTPLAVFKSNPFKSNPFDNLTPDIAISTDITELPSSFSDAVERAAVRTYKCFESGSKLCRIDFDTTIGDQTYTSLKSTLPMTKEFVAKIYEFLNPTPEFGETDSQIGTVRIFFPGTRTFHFHVINFTNKITSVRYGSCGVGKARLEDGHK